ncbi:MAG TPA: NHL repeat-containing protein [bacterium]|nr:NHL repeat-containing protein [bacterium]
MRRVLWFILLGLLGLTQINCGPKASPSSPSSSSGNAYSFVTNIGQYGDAYNPYQFYQITGVAVSGDKLFVGDNDYDVIQEYDLSGNYLTYFTPHYNWGPVVEPDSLAADAYGHLYIGDADEGEIAVMNIASIPSPSYAIGQAVTVSDAYGTDCYPGALAVDQNGIIYVADYDCGEIYTMNQYGINSGYGLGSGFGTDSGSASINGGFLDNPNGIAVTPDGSKVYVADSNNNVVQVYNSGSTGLTWVSVIGDATGASSTATGKFDSPAGLALDGAGNLFVADSNNARIQKFSASGKFLTSIGDTANSISNGQLQSPWAIAVDAAGEVFVTDTNYETVFKYTSN